MECVNQSLDELFFFAKAASPSPFKCQVKVDLGSHLAPFPSEQSIWPSQDPRIFLGVHLVQRLTRRHNTFIWCHR